MTLILPLQGGASPHAISKSLKTPIMEAAAGGHIKIVQYLLKSGAVVDTKVCLTIFLFDSFHSFYF